MATNEDLNKIINAYNKCESKWTIKISLSGYIDYITFLETKEMKLNSEINYVDFNNYFLLKMNNKYVGIIQDMENDLHIYIKKSYRKKTNLIEELNNTIIPFLLNKREAQKLTFINEKVEQYFLSSLHNIKKVSDLKAIIENSYINYEYKEYIFNINEFEKFKNIVIKSIQLKRKINKFFDNKKARWLCRESFISDNDYFLLSDDEKIDFTYEEFQFIQKEFNYMKKLSKFYEKILIVNYGDNKKDNFNDHIYELSIKDIKLLTMGDFENI